MSKPAGVSDEAFESMRATRVKAHALLGQAGVTFIQELHREGLIDGWRRVVWVGTHEEAEARRASEPGRTMTGREFTEYCNEALKWIS